MAMRTVFGNRDVREKKSLPNKDYYKTLIDSKKEATFLTDTEGDIFLLNKKAQSLTGYSEEEIREYHIRDIFVTLKQVDNPLDTGQLSEFTSRLYLLDARRYLLPVMFDFKEIEGQKFLCTCIQIDEKEIPVKAREKSPQPADGSSPVSIISAGDDLSSHWTIDFEHQVRNLLNNMLGFGSILAREPSILNDKHLSVTLDSILKSGNQLKKIFNQASFGETASYEIIKTACLLAPILQKASILLEPVARQNNLTLRIRQTIDTTLFTDEFLLSGLFRFLFEKALTYTRNDEVGVDVKEDGATGKVIITIDNLGQDIPQGIINFIKRENSKEKYDLNNPILAPNPEIKSMLQTLNLTDGKITFTTGDSLGEIAQITFPVSSGIDSSDDLAKMENEIRSKSLNILIIEDEKFTASILKTYLEDISAVSVAYSGNEALNITEIFYNKGIVFHTVIMDIGLPKPWDGILLKKEMEKKWPEYVDIPFLAQTAFTSKSYTDRITDGKFKGYLVKPVNRNDIISFIHRFL